LQEAGLKPTALTYNVLISACMSENPGLIEDDGEFGILHGARLDVEALHAALLVLEDMKQADVSPNVSTYNHLIHICQRTMRPDKALELFEDMKA
jgi:pentatricopeptide repeat protein